MAPVVNESVTAMGKGKEPRQPNEDITLIHEWNGVSGEALWLMVNSKG